MNGFPGQDVITRFGLADLPREGPRGRYLRVVRECIHEIERIGLPNVSMEEADSLKRRLAQAQLRWLVEDDTGDGFYAEAFSHLDLTPDGVEASALLDGMAYPVGQLANGRAEHARMARSVPREGRVFWSSGTSDPTRRKSIFYDRDTAVLLREVNRIGWETVSGTRISSGGALMMLAPPEARLAMPFGSLVADMFAARGVKVYWGARFVHRPRLRVDATFGVPTAKLDFRNNVEPSRGHVARFNVHSKLARAASVIMGLLPSIAAMARATARERGVGRFFATPAPSVIGFGGGLKNMGVLPDIQARGSNAIAAFLETVGDWAGLDPAVLEDWYERGAAALDEVLTGFWAAEIGRLLGASCLNIFAGAELQPCLFPVMDTATLVGVERPDGTGRGADVYAPLPGVEVDLLDPITAERIPPDQTDRAGVLRMWNPYNASHLHAIETEDMMKWVPIPDAATWKPAYMGGVGLRFAGRVAAACSGGYCAA